MAVVERPGDRRPTVRGITRGLERSLEELSGTPEHALLLEGMHVLVDALDREARLDAIGRAIAHIDLRRALRGRIAVRRAPAPPSSAVEAPVFIVGFPRTGSTLLHRLLAVDPAHRVLTMAEGLYPSARRVGALRVPRVAGEAAFLRARSPDLQRIHPIGANEPEECFFVLKQTFAAIIYGLFYDVPSYVSWLREQDLRPTYAYLRDAYAVGQRGSNRRWIGKSPVHIFAIDALLAEFPDATIVQTHRDPAQVVGSLASLTAALRRLSSSDVRVGAIGEEMAAHLELGLQRLGDSRARAGSERFVDIPYARLVAEPIAVLDEIYRRTGRALPAEVERDARAWLAANPQHKHGVHAYALEEFGIDACEVEARFAGYAETVASMSEGTR